jgi:hypothetical protein
MEITMKSRIGVAAWVAASWLAVTAVGAAEPAQQKADSGPAAVTATGNASADKTKATTKVKAADKEKKKQEQNCTTTTGTRIRREPPADCASMPGQHTYTAEEIASTGEMNVSDALRKLDPRLQ